MKRITLNTAILLITSVLSITVCTAKNYVVEKAMKDVQKPNVIMLMADDLGWGDVGFNGNDVVMTPHLDEMSKSGIRHTNFYAAAPLCSPSRAACLTGRAPFRQGIYAAHTGGLRYAEKTIPELLKKDGYVTGHFGKWHLGWLEADKVESRGHYSPPCQHGYDEVFGTKSAVPTWNPTKTPAGWKGFGSEDDGSWGGSVYLHDGVPVTDNLDGDDSRIIMDRAIPFIQKAIDEDEPFFTTIWFHTPHEPVVAGPEYLAMYPDIPSDQKHLYGCITAMDEQIGRLREMLESNGVAENTIIFFTSDNGPSGPITRKGIASAGPFKGAKHEIYEGGIRVPALMEWKGHIKSGTSAVSAGVVDYLPTILDLVGISPMKKVPLDGESLLPILRGETSEREQPLAFGFKRLYKGIEMYAFIEGDYKIAIPKMGKEVYLFNLKEDPSEENNLAASQPELTKEMLKKLEETKASWQDSDDGKDYLW